MQEEFTKLQNKDDKHNVCEIDKILNQKICCAKQGEMVWSSIKKKKNNIQDYVLLFPKGDDEASKYGMMYLDSFAERNGINGICVCTNSKYVRKNIKKHSACVSQIIVMEDEDVENLIHFYSVFEFEKNFNVVSFTEPYCRYAADMIGKNGITKEHLIAIGVYRLIPFEKIECK